MEGYFKTCIELWDSLKTKSKANKKDMRNIIRQFETATDYGELDTSTDTYRYLKRRFSEIGRGLI